jgi:integrase
MNHRGFCLFKRSNGYWYIVYSDGRRRRWISTKARRKNEALLFLSEFQQHTKPKPRKLLLSEFIKEYEEIQAPVLRESTLKGIYGIAFKNFISVCGDRELSSYTAWDVDMFKARRSKACSPTTVNIQFRSLKSAFNCAVKWDFIEENPFAKCSQLRIPERPPNYLSEVEFGRLHSATANLIFKRLFLFAVLTGMRLGEILNLQWPAVDMERKLILVSNSEGFLTKTGKVRVVPMSDKVFDLLHEIRIESDARGFVFLYNRNKLNRSYVDHKFRECRKGAGLSEEITFHSLRHTFATWLVQKGVSIYEVQKLLGHSDIKVTQIYSHLVASELHGAVNKLSF